MSTTNLVDVTLTDGERFTAEYLKDEVSGMPRQDKLVFDARGQDIDAQPPLRYLCGDGLHRIPASHIADRSSILPAEDGSISVALSVSGEPLRQKLTGNRLFRIGLGEHDIFCDSPGTTPGSVLFGLLLQPVVECPGTGDSMDEKARYCDACGQRVEPKRTRPNEWPHHVPAHEATPEVIEAYGLDPQASALYFDANKAQIEGLIAQLQRVIDDNAGTWEVQS